MPHRVHTYMIDIDVSLDNKTSSSTLRLEDMIEKFAELKEKIITFFIY